MADLSSAGLGIPQGPKVAVPRPHWVADPQIQGTPSRVRHRGGGAWYSLTCSQAAAGSPAQNTLPARAFFQPSPTPASRAAAVRALGALPPQTPIRGPPPSLPAVAPHQATAGLLPGVFRHPVSATPQVPPPFHRDNPCGIRQGPTQYLQPVGDPAPGCTAGPASAASRSSRQLRRAPISWVPLSTARGRRGEARGSFQGAHRLRVRLAAHQRTKATPCSLSSARQ
ncbi:hypothetical protein NDU88_007985 [Pleurodeles waltl]|uniref:Uncharacterized protein n=1 Tax=Pleurodeles waltl TaxID=8319 RepID=A0AAV7RTB8_PLEWA|nr:hypothetical protein NDU88_007985 [Pleurodeles waltl]